MKPITEWLVLIAYVALVYVLVRPGSQGPTLVSNSTKGVASILSAATGGGTWASA
jgi:hypothetical protein